MQEGPVLFDRRTEDPGTNSVTAFDIITENNSDSYLSSAMHAMAERDPEALKEIITDNKDGTYNVSMFDHKLNPVSVKVNQGDLSKVTIQMDNPSENWGQVLEAAFDKQYDGYDGMDKDTPALAFAAFTGKESSVFQANIHFFDKLNEALDAGKMVVFSTFQDATQSFEQTSHRKIDPVPARQVQPFHSYAVSQGQDLDNSASIRVWSEDGGMSFIDSGTALFSGEYYATVVDGDLKPTPLDPRKSHYSAPEISDANPMLHETILNWGFAKDGHREPFAPLEMPEVTKARVDEMLALNDIYFKSGVKMQEVKELYQGEKSGFLTGLRDRNLSLDEIPDFVQDFRTKDNGRFKTELLDQFVNNTKNLKAEKFKPLWEAGVNAGVVASIANRPDGGLLKELNERKLGVEGMKSAINRVVINDDNYEFVDTASISRLSDFNGVAKHKPHEWAQSLLRTNVPYLDPITAVLDSRVLREIIDDRHVGADRAGRVFEWASERADNVTEGILKELERFNERTKSKNRHDIWAHIDNGTIDEFIA